MKKFVIIMIFLFILNFINIASVPALSVVVHVPEKYTDVQAGERFYFEVEVKYPENPSRKDLTLNYEIIDEDNNLLAQSKVLKAIETQASFIDFIVIPESAEKGLHLIKVKISDYEDLSEEVSASFHVISTGGKIKIYFFILLGTIIFIGILIMVVIFMRKKK